MKITFNFLQFLTIEMKIPLVLFSIDEKKQTLEPSVMRIVVDLLRNQIRQNIVIKLIESKMVMNRILITLK